MHRLEFPEDYQGRVGAFLINDSFKRSSNVCKEMTGNMFVQHLYLKWLTIHVVISMLKFVLWYIYLNLLFFMHACKDKKVKFKWKMEGTS